MEFDGVEKDYEDVDADPCCWSGLTPVLRRRTRCTGSIVINLLQSDERIRLAKALSLVRGKFPEGYFNETRDLTTCATTRPRRESVCKFDGAPGECLYRCVLTYLGVIRSTANIVCLKRHLTREIDSWSSATLEATGYLGTILSLTDLIRRDTVAAEPAVLYAIAAKLKRDVYLYAESPDESANDDGRWHYFRYLLSAEDVPTSSALYLWHHEGHFKVVVSWDTRHFVQPERARTSRVGGNGTGADEPDDVEEEEALEQARSKSATFPNFETILHAIITGPDVTHRMDVQSQFERYVGERSLIDVRPFVDVANQIEAVARRNDVGSDDSLQALFAACNRLVVLSAASALRANQACAVATHTAAQLSTKIDHVQAELDNAAPIPKCNVVPSMQSFCVRIYGQEPCDLAVACRAVSTSLKNLSYKNRITIVTRHLLKQMIQKHPYCYTWNQSSRRTRYLSIDNSARTALLEFMYDCFHIDQNLLADQGKVRMLDLLVRATTNGYFNESRQQLRKQKQLTADEVTKRITRAVDKKLPKYERAQQRREDDAAAAAQDH